ncbi:DUF1990 family protein [Streptomyces sp. NPDC060194]|uniref:DUF1990 family protein n=1 Tax=Streptomyces sp. NPDC060194 TaxID=3347069 RepID=UPI0036589F46
MEHVRPVPQGLTYPEAGATARTPLPAGYRHLRHRARIGHGRAAFEAAGAAVNEWRMHNALVPGILRLTAPVPRAEVGAEVLVTITRLISAPCVVVWTSDEPDRLGFAYGTLPGHPEHGEEAFLVELDHDGTVWCTVTAFSLPAARYVRLAGPLVPLLQHAYARRCARVLRRIARG